MMTTPKLTPEMLRQQFDKAVREGKTEERHRETLEAILTTPAFIGALEADNAAMPIAPGLVAEPEPEPESEPDRSLDPEPAADPLADPADRWDETTQAPVPTAPVDVAAGVQPAPHPTTGPDVVDLVVVDLMSRKRLGTARYGTPLQAHNGRDALMDAYQEALDLCAYLRQAIAERDALAAA